MANPEPGRAKAIAREALKRGPAARQAYLAEACAGDERLRQEVDRLLGIEASREDEAPTPDRVAGVRDPWPGAEAPDAGLPRSLGGFQLLRVIGEGGMGTVYEALQDNPRRTVAVKVLRAGLGPRRAHRFQIEAEALGRLSHPGIARVYRAGVEEEPGRPPRAYLAMELVEGLTLLEHAQRHGLGTRERLELLARICDAVDHAHRQGVVHRDLKPANILVLPGGEPKLVDFGVARLLDLDPAGSTLGTLDGDILGTLSYLSPEQAAGQPSELDARSDVYALGVIGYELLTGRLPYPIAAVPVMDALRNIRESEPETPARADPSLKGEISLVLLKALKKSPERRYPSAAELAADLRRYLADRPVLARPPSTAYRARKFVRRHRALVAAALAVLLALLGGFAASLVLMIDATRARDRAVASERLTRQARERAERFAYRASIAAAQGALREGDVRLARAYLESAPEGQRCWLWKHLHAELDQSLRSLSGQGRVSQLAFSADGSSLLLLSHEGPVSFRLLRWIDASSGEKLGEAVLYPDRPVRVRAQDLPFVRRHLVFAPGEVAIDLADVATGRSFGQARRCGPGDAWSTLHATHPGKDLAFLSGPGTAWHVCNLASGQEVLAGDWGKDANLRPDVAAFDTQGRRLAVRREEWNVVVFDLRTGRELGTLTGPLDTITEMGFLPGGELATVSASGVVRLWDVPGRRILRERRLGRGRVFSPHLTEARLALVSRLSVSGYDIATDRRLGPLMGHTSSIAHVALKAGTWLAATVSEPGTVHIWDLDLPLRVLTGHTSYVYPVRYTADGFRLVSGGWDGTVRVWEPATGEALAVIAVPPGSRPLETAVTALALRTDGQRIAAGTPGGVHLFDGATGSLLRSWRTEEGAVQALEYSPDGVELWVSLGGPVRDRRAERPRVVVLDAESLAVHADIAGLAGALAFRPDGAILASGSVTGEVLLLDPLTRIEVGRLAGTGTRRKPEALAWDESGSLLVAGTEDGWIHVFREGGEWRRVRPVSMRILSLAFAPDGGRLLVASREGPVVALDVATWDQVGQLEGHDASIYSLAFRPDGRQLATGSGDSTIRLWTTETVSDIYRAQQERQRCLAEARPVCQAAFAGRSEPPAAVAEVVERTAAADACVRRAARDLALGFASGSTRR